MRRRIWLNGSRLCNRSDMSDYMSEVFNFPDYFGRNLDALHDCLEEVDEEVDVVLDRECVKTMCSNDYAYKVLLILGRAAQNNPNIRILFR